MEGTSFRPLHVHMCVLYLHCTLQLLAINKIYKIFAWKMRFISSLEIGLIVNRQKLVYSIMRPRLKSGYSVYTYDVCVCMHV